MSKKYPTCAFNARDVQELIIVLEEYLHGLTIITRGAATKADPHRISVLAAGYRKITPIGSKTRLEALRYVAGNKPGSIDRTTFDVLWELCAELDAPRDLWGTYTTLTEMPTPRP